VIGLPRLPNIAIDGPAGSGKSTVAKRVAQRLNYLYVDTGAMYRAVAYLALRQGVDMADQEALTSLARSIKFSLVRRLKEGTVTLWCNGEDVTPCLRTMEVARAVAWVAAVSGVRGHLVKCQRFFSVSGGVVMEGRDIETVVMPDAEFKFFLTADLETRLERRRQEMVTQGKNVDPQKLREQFIFRDQMDLKRTIGPLKKATDALEIDGTDKTIEELVEIILTACGGGC
jgi:cytidylate kinase